MNNLLVLIRFVHSVFSLLSVVMLIKQAILINIYIYNQARYTDKKYIYIYNQGKLLKL